MFQCAFFSVFSLFFFFFNDTATTEIYTLSLHDALPILRISEAVPADGRELYKRALEQGWEGLIAKGVNSIYHTGKRTHDWRKLKILREQEFVIGGWTEARATGRPFGALLVG